MHKILIKMIVVLGGFLFISAFTTSLPMDTSHSTSLEASFSTCASCHPLFLTEITFIQIDGFNQSLSSAVDVLYIDHKAHSSAGIYCITCHDSQQANYSVNTPLDNDQSSRLQSHVGSSAGCEICHLQRPEKAIWHFGGET